MKSHRRDQLEVQRTASAGVLGAVAIVALGWGQPRQWRSPLVQVEQQVVLTRELRVLSRSVGDVGAKLGSQD